MATRERRAQPQACVCFTVHAELLSLVGWISELHWWARAQVRTHQSTHRSVTHTLLHPWEIRLSTIDMHFPRLTKKTKKLLL